MVREGGRTIRKTGECAEALRSGLARDIQVKDLMLSLDEYATISAEATIREALVALSKAQLGLTYDRHHHRAILVLDVQGRVVGKLTHWGILQALEPKLLSSFDEDALSRTNLSPDFIRSLIDSSLARYDHGPRLATMCAAAARVKVKEAMIRAPASIDEDASLTDAIRMLVLGHWQSVLVQRDTEVVGILRMADVFEEIADLIRGGADAPE